MTVMAVDIVPGRCRGLGGAGDIAVDNLIDAGHRPGDVVHLFGLGLGSQRHLVGQSGDFHPLMLDILSEPGHQDNTAQTAPFPTKVPSRAPTSTSVG